MVDLLLRAPSRTSSPGSVEAVRPMLTGLLKYVVSTELLAQALTKHMLTVDYYLPWILQVSHFGIMGTALELTELIVSDTGRTIHIHTMIHTSWSKSANG